jgi:transposase InsO family protein
MIFRKPELLNTEWFHSVKQAQVAINIWLKEYNHIRPHHALGMRPPVPETLLEKTRNLWYRNWGARQYVISKTKAFSGGKKALGRFLLVSRVF